MTRKIEDLTKRIKQYEGEDILASGITLADGEELFDVKYSYSICYYERNKKSGWRETRTRSRVHKKRYLMVLLILLVQVKRLRLM